MAEKSRSDCWSDQSAVHDITNVSHVQITTFSQRLKGFFTLSAGQISTQNTELSVLTRQLNLSECVHHE